MRFRLPAPVLITLIGLACATLIGLGAWQVQRAGWKADLVAARNAQLAAPPLTNAEASTLDGPALDYRVVALSGAWDADHLLILANRARYGVKGENVVEPLVLPTGEAVLVDRGWYPVAEREATLERIHGRAGDGPNDATPATASGLALDARGQRATQTPAGTWTAIAPASMAAGLPYPVLPWFVVEGGLLTPAEQRSMPAAFPAQGFVPYSNTTPHVEYALTWFGLAGALVVIAVLRFIVEPRRARARR